MRKGRRLAIDVGKARIGLAISDQDGILAVPFATVARVQDSLDSTVSAFVSAVDDYSFIEAYVGLPIGLSGHSTASTDDAVEVGTRLATALGLEAFFIDERLTTVSATANLRLAGKTAKNSRQIIDQEAAAIILEQALQHEKQQGSRPGRSREELVEAGLVSA
jgi:putative Holliday junction resolvase